MISIIIPVYNVEKYLDECVQSVLRQTYTDYEIILVDDGSTDKSGFMCDEYAHKYKRVRVIHKENGGLSDARNKGTEHAKGSFLTYIDSDDYVSSSYLETLWGLVNRYKVDIATTGIERFYDGDKPKGEKSRKKVAVFSGTEALLRVLYQDGMDTSACALLISKKIASNHLFPYGRYHEDDFTTYKYYLDAQKVAVSFSKQYYYRQRSESIMNTVGKPIFDEKEASDNLVNEINKVEPQLYRAARAKKFSNYCQIYLKLANCKEKNRDFEKTIEQYLRKESKNIVFDKRARKKNRVAGIIILLSGARGFRLIGNMTRKV